MSPKYPGPDVSHIRLLRDGDEPSPIPGKRQFILNKDNTISGTPHNRLVALDKHMPDAIGMDLFLGGFAWLKRPPAPWGDSPTTIGALLTSGDFTRMSAWMESNGIRAEPEKWAQSVEAVAKHFSSLTSRVNKHPVWDHTPRVDMSGTTYFKAKDCPLVRMVMSRFWLGYAARLRNPGCEVQTMLVLHGDQGAYKSRACKIIAGAVRKDEGDAGYHAMRKFESKDDLIGMRGRVIIEFAELAAIRKGDVESVKAFISASVDSYRPPYAKDTIDFPRPCVFIGSTNDDTPYRDHTGNRRFMPLTIPKGEHIDLDRLECDRDQLLAEAFYRVNAKERYWASAEDEVLIEAETSERMEEDPISTLVPEFLLTRPDLPAGEYARDLRVTDIMVWAKLQLGDTGAARRIATALRGSGYTRHKTMGVFVWRKPKAEQTEG